MKFVDLRKKGDLVLKLRTSDPEMELIVESTRFMKSVEQAIAWRNDFTQDIEDNHGGFDELKTSDLTGKFERFLLKAGFPVKLAHGKNGRKSWDVVLYR